MAKAGGAASPRTLGAPRGCGAPADARRRAHRPYMRISSPPDAWKPLAHQVAFAPSSFALARPM